MRARLIAAAGAVGLLAACAGQPPASAPPAPPAPAAVETAPALPPPTHPGLTLAAVGDMMLGTDFPENTLPDDDGLSFFDAVTPLLEAPDVTFGNLEGVLQDGGEPVKQCKNPKICFLFRSPSRYATLFQARGFRCALAGQQPCARFRRDRPLLEHGGARRGRHPALGP